MPLDRFEETIDLVMSPLDGEPEVWRQDVTHTLRCYMEADRALMMLWEDGAPRVYSDGLPNEVIREYLDHFAPLDYGMARRDELQLTVWSRSLLWDRRALLRSAYFHEFALRHDLQDAVGLSVDMPGIPAHLRVAFLYGGAPLREDALQVMLRRLSFIVPVLRTSFGIHLRNLSWLGSMHSMLDRVGQRLILFSLDGRELHRNVTMRRMLEQEPEQRSLLQAAQAVAQAVVAAGHRVDPESNRFATPADSRRDVETRLARYRLRGCRLGPDSATPEAGVLVSVDRMDNSDAPSAEGLRRRYGLTAREAQVASHLAQRLTNDEIASALGISSHTARHHTESVLLKLGVTSRRALRRLLAS
jgi:DNA-binding CsgD family transcriptional regulator